MRQALLDRLEGGGASSDARTWKKHQTSGELDDDRLVDAFAGDQNVYRRRGRDADDFDEWAGRVVSKGTGDASETSRDADAFWLRRPLAEPKRPKLRMKVCVDLGSSTYANDQKDQRLRRVLETTVLLFEAFDGIPSSLGCEWSLSAFSGSGPELRLKKWRDAPLDIPRKGAAGIEPPRLRLIRRMAAHAQYARDGDATLSAAAAALTKVRNSPADAYRARAEILLFRAARRRDELREDG